MGKNELQTKATLIPLIRLRNKTKKKRKEGKEKMKDYRIICQKSYRPTYMVILTARAELGVVLRVSDPGQNRKLDNS